jgi:hypothetical protein
MSFSFDSWRTRTPLFRWDALHDAGDVFTAAPPCGLVCEGVSNVDEDEVWDDVLNEGRDIRGEQGTVAGWETYGMSRRKPSCTFL